MSIGKHNSDWRRPDYDGLNPSLTDWARLAAYIDGEGCVLINRRSRKSQNACGFQNENFYLRVMVANTDVRLMQWLKETFGGAFTNADPNKYKRVPVATYKMAYHWGCSSSKAAWLFHNCHQFFIVKKEQSELAMQLQDSMSESYRRTGVPVEVIKRRRDIKNKMLLIKADNKHPQFVEIAKKEIAGAA